MSFSTPASCSQEILFGPLTGIEVLNVRVDGSVIIIECAFSINLTALTLDQVWLSACEPQASSLCQDCQS